MHSFDYFKGFPVDVGLFSCCNYRQHFVQFVTLFLHLAFDSIESRKLKHIRNIIICVNIRDNAKQKLRFHFFDYHFCFVASRGLYTFSDFS